MLRCTIKCSSYTSCYGQFTNKDTIIIDFDHYYIIDILYTYLPILPNWYFYQMIALYKFHLCSPCVVFHIKAPRKGTYIIFHWNIRQHRGKFLVFFFFVDENENGTDHSLHSSDRVGSYYHETRRWFPIWNWIANQCGVGCKLSLFWMLWSLTLASETFIYLI